LVTARGKSLREKARGIKPSLRGKERAGRSIQRKRVARGARKKAFGWRGAGFARRGVPTEKQRIVDKSDAVWNEENAEQC